MWPSLPFLWLFLQGYSYMFLLSVLPARRGAAGAGLETEGTANEALADLSA